MTPILIGARFKRPLNIDANPFYEFGAWLRPRDAYLISAWGNAIWALTTSRDLDESFTELQALLGNWGLDDLVFVEVGSRSWSFERVPPLEASLAFYERFRLYDEPPETDDDEEPEDDGEPTAEQVFGPSPEHDDDAGEDDDELSFEEVLAARMRELPWPITSWRERLPHWYPDPFPTCIDEWLRKPFVERPKFGPKAILLILRDDRRDDDKVIDLLRAALGPDAMVRCHGRRSILLIGRTDMGVEQICAIENVNRRLRENRFLISACFEIGPAERMMHASLQGTLIPPRTAGASSRLALESQLHRARRHRGHGRKGR